MLSRIRKKAKGFTLIELMIVVAIIGILAAIAIPNFMNYQCKAKQSEAKSNLGNIRTAQEAYYAEHDEYSNSTAAIGFSTKGSTIYTYAITTNGTGASASFTAGATATTGGKVKDDIWTINNLGNLVNVTSTKCGG